MKATIALLLRQVCSSAEQYGRACMKDWDLSPAQGFVLDHLLAQQGEACATELHRQFGINGVINMKTPDFSLFSLPLKISLHFAALSECRSCPWLFSGVFRHWHALPCFQTHGVMALLPLPGVSHSDGHVIFKVLLSLDKYSLTKNRACSCISKRLENGCETQKFPRL